LRAGNSFEELPAPAPLTRRLAAAIGASDQLLLRINLLMQSDDCKRPAEPSPTNLDIEALWQQTLDRHQALHPSGLPAAPVCQKDGQGWRPFRPLWFCRQKARYAHALCPDCGHGLELCRDDVLLAGAGLAQYGRSALRYLFCSACSGQGARPRFYSAVPGGNADGVGDPRALAAGFGRLLERTALEAELPCIGCPETRECFGPPQAALERIQPLCFYPFYMLIQPAPAFDAASFAALLQAADQAGSAAPDGLLDADLDRQLGDLRDEIKRCTPEPAGTRPAQLDSGHPADREIAAVVAEMLRQWPAEAPAGENGITRPHEGDVAETIILHARPEPLKSVLKEAAPDADMEKTVVLTEQETAQSTHHDLDATVVLGSRVPNPPPADDFCETVVLTRDGRAAAEPELDATVVVNAGAVPRGGEELEKTVLMSPPDPGAGKYRPGSAQNTEEDLEATVMIDPRALKAPPGKSQG